MVALWSAIFAVAVLLFLALHIFVMPKIFFRVRFRVQSPAGRGIKVIRERSGKSIVYDSDVKIRKYIPQYLISERNGKKQLVCRVNEHLAYLDYDIAIFDQFNTVTDILHVREAIGEREYTKPVDLPDHAAYAAVYLNEADGRTFQSRLKGRISGKCWAGYLFMCALIDILAVFAVRLCLANLFGGIYGESFLNAPASKATAWAIAAIVIAFNAVLAPLAVRLRARKKGDRV